MSASYASRTRRSRSDRSDDSGSSTPGWMIPAAIIMVAVLVIVPVLYFVVTLFIKENIKTTGERHQSDMMSAHQEFFNKLNTCSKETKLVSATAKANAAAFQQTVLAISMREGQFANADLSTSRGQQAVAAILTQTWPDINNGQSELFKELVRTIRDCNDRASNEQTAVLQEVKEFRGWMAGYWVRKYGKEFPNSGLVVTAAGGKVVATGPDAFRRISTVVMTAGTSETAETGVDKSDEDLSDEINGDPSSTPVPSTTR